jgi:hypothetical protein
VSRGTSRNVAVAGKEEAAAMSIQFRDGKSKASFPWFLSIKTPLANPTEDGLTTDEEAAVLNDWEDKIER